MRYYRLFAQNVKRLFFKTKTKTIRSPSINLVLITSFVEQQQQLKNQYIVR